MTAAASFLPSFSKVPCITAPPRRLSSRGTWKARIGIAVVRAGVSAERARVSAGEKKDGRPIIVIDNYDSFTYNLCQLDVKNGFLQCDMLEEVYMEQPPWFVAKGKSVEVCHLRISLYGLKQSSQYIGELGVDFEVFRNDELTVEDIRRKNPKGILISPGPGAPQDSGISLQTVVELGPSIPLFGVCMGLQCIGEAFGGKIVRSPSGVRHGKSSLVYYDEQLEEDLFDGLSNPFSACRYHSLVIEKETFPGDKLEITAWTEDGLIMAARHKKYKHIKGVQFHPESIITPDGKIIILNFIKFVDKFQE